MDFIIYSIGDSQWLFEIINAIAMIFQSDTMGSLIRLGLLLGFIAALFQGLMAGGKTIEVQHLLIGIIIFNGFFIPKKDVLIEDVYTGAVVQVDNVPLGVAFTGALFSQIGYKITQLFETAYNPLDPLGSTPKLQGQSYLESLKVLNGVRRDGANNLVWNAMNQSAGGDFVDFHRSWLNYIRDCSLGKVSFKEITPEQIQNQPFLSALQFNSNSTFELHLDSSSALPSVAQCNTGFSTLNDATESALESEAVRKAMNSILRINASNSTGDSIEKIESAIDMVYDADTSAKTYMQLAILEPIMLDATAGKYNSLLDTSAAMMINESIQKRNTQWAAEQTLFQSIVRPMIAFFEGFVFAIAPIMAFVFTLGKSGITLGMKYFALLIWIQLWYPLLSVTNLFITIAARREIQEFKTTDNFNWDSFYAMTSAADIASSWIATGGMLAASIPVIAFMLIYGSSTTATAIANRMKGDHINESTQSPSISSSTPILDKRPSFTADSISGIAATGSQQADRTLSTANESSAAIQSLSSQQTQSANSFQKALNRTLTNSASVTSNAQLASEIGQMQASNGSTGVAALDQEIQSIRSTYSDNKDLANQIVGQTILSAVARGGFSKSGKTKKNDQKQDATSPNTEDSDSNNIDISRGPLSAGLGIQGNITDTETSSHKISSGSDSSDQHNVQLSKEDRANLTKQISSALKNSRTISNSSSDQYSELAQAADNHSVSSQRLEQFQNTASELQKTGFSQQISLIAASNSIVNDADKSSLATLNNGFNAQTISDPQLRSRYNEHLGYAKSQNLFAGDEQKADVWAKLMSLSDTNDTTQSRVILESLASTGISSTPTNHDSARRNDSIVNDFNTENSGVIRGVTNADSRIQTEGTRIKTDVSKNISESPDQIYNQSSDDISKNYSDGKESLEHISHSNSSSINKSAYDDIKQKLNSRTNQGDHLEPSIGVYAQAFGDNSYETSEAFLKKHGSTISSIADTISDENASIIRSSKDLSNLTDKQIEDTNNAYFETLHAQNPEQNNWSEQFKDSMNGYWKSIKTGGEAEIPDGMSPAAFNDFIEKATAVDFAVAAQDHQTRMNEINTSTHKALHEEAKDKGIPTPELQSVYAESAKSTLLTGDPKQILSSSLGAIQSLYNTGSPDSEPLQLAKAQYKLTHAPSEDQLAKVDNGDNQYSAYYKNDDGTASDRLAYTYETRDGNIVNVTLADKSEEQFTNDQLRDVADKARLGDLASHTNYSYPQAEIYFTKSK